MSTRGDINHEPIIHKCMIRSGNMKLLNELFSNDSSKSIIGLVARHGKPQLIDVESMEDKKSVSGTLAEIYSNNPGLVNVHKRVKQILKERGLL